ncbi:uncharacterized protein CLUP02_14196 [Colletotrichum lupini]|uniref:Uncharacterized protein n=1 Tax=Colletotrichum lupini TaxID=145971 RepID=A0A9Q8WMH8_9PEZI|nr:uncharacterized protein CLUP02_14196 [Colletotrichum lupini]UQC88671.1 hypothetical protein CLUP02_14196 [Colletotrichum lupini]
MTSTEIAPQFDWPFPKVRGIAIILKDDSLSFLRYFIFYEKFLNSTQKRHLRPQEKHDFTMAYNESRLRVKRVVRSYGQYPKPTTLSPPTSPTSEARFPALLRLLRELRDMIYEYSDTGPLQNRLWVNLSYIYSELHWKRVGTIRNEVMDTFFAKSDFQFEPSTWFSLANLNNPI